MPFAGFVCPICDALLPWPDPAREHFETVHPVVPVGALAASFSAPEDEARRGGDFLSPSMAGGCMREHALRRTEATWVNPYDVWKMTEGTLWHKVMAGVNVPGWLTEVALPEAFVPERHDRAGDCDPEEVVVVDGAAPVRVRRRNYVWELELWPDVWLSGRADVLKRDYTALDDYKSKSCPVGSRDKATGTVKYNIGNYGASADHVTQLNLYGLMVERLTGVRPALRVWQLWKGIQDARLAWSAQAVPHLEEGVLRGLVEGDFKALCEVMRVEDKAQRREAIAGMPLQGRTQMGGKKCFMYCGQKKACDALLPVEERY